VRTTDFPCTRFGLETERRGSCLRGERESLALVSAGGRGLRLNCYRMIADFTIDNRILSQRETLEERG